ncbi:hypothetical protein JI739_02320 [Ramlibacter sp. AW1]|uniref:Uncharacterized protein n=1 Tax=Ramlibacter aurantiacus TaxID=2801330 RepID=A0A936ZDY4_9BURK|nr:hypothetical protein [Ramlibacter aurantiacus]MBL0419172.1 hypothetical protein [Ramlibacter aurantiacus]
MAFSQAELGTAIHRALERARLNPVRSQEARRWTLCVQDGAGRALQTMELGTLHEVGVVANELAQRGFDPAVDDPGPWDFIFSPGLEVGA